MASGGVWGGDNFRTVTPFCLILRLLSHLSNYIKRKKALYHNDTGPSV